MRWQQMTLPLDVNASRHAVKAAMPSSIHSYNLAVLECATRTLDRQRKMVDQQRMEELRSLVGRPDFKSGRGCQQSLVGSTPTLFRHPFPSTRP